MKLNEVLDADGDEQALINTYAHTAPSFAKDLRNGAGLAKIVRTHMPRGRETEGLRENLEWIIENNERIADALDSMADRLFKPHSQYHGKSRG